MVVFCFIHHMSKKVYNDTKKFYSGLTENILSNIFAFLKSFGSLCQPEKFSEPSEKIVYTSFSVNNCIFCPKIQNDNCNHAWVYYGKAFYLQRFNEISKLGYLE